MKRPCKHATLKVRVEETERGATYRLWACRCRKIELRQLLLQRTQPLEVNYDPFFPVNS